MYTYPLRARSKCGEYLIEFDLCDGPCPLDERYFFLAKWEGSPILDYKSITRGGDIPNIFAGDLIEKGGKKYLVSYHRGLVARNLETKELLDLKLGDFTKVSTIYSQNIEMINKHTKHLYRYGRATFFIEQLFGIIGDTIILNRRKSLFIPLEEVHQYAGIKDPNTKKDLFFGDYDLTMENGHLMASKDGEIINITLGGKL